MKKPMDSDKKVEKRVEAPAEAAQAAPVAEEKIDFSKVQIEPLFVDFETFRKSGFRDVKVKACEAVPESKKLLKFVLDDEGTDRVILSGIPAYYEPEELIGKTLVAVTDLPPHEDGEEKFHLLMVDPHVPAGEEEKIDFSKAQIEPLFAEFVDFETFSESDLRAVKVKACEAVPESKKLLKFVVDDDGTDRVILSGIHAYYEPEELIGKTLVLVAISNVHHEKDNEGEVDDEEEVEEEFHLLMVDPHIPAGAKLY